MTIVCDKCHKPYHARQAMTFSELSRLTCPHCGSVLWVSLPQEPCVRRSPGKNPRGLS